MRIIHKSREGFWFPDTDLPFYHKNTIKSHKDYYDGFQDYTDKQSLWLREPKLIEFTPNEYKELSRCGFDLTLHFISVLTEFFPPKHRDIAWRKANVPSLFVIGFCGKIHHGLQYEDRYYFDDAIFTFLEDNVYLYYKNVSKAKEERKSKLDKVRKIVEKNMEAQVLTTYFTKYKTPIFAMWSAAKIEIIPHLYSIDFCKVIGAGEAFQAIERYLTNELATEPVIPTSVGDNNTKILAAGFDLKHSFRNTK